MKITLCFFLSLILLSCENKMEKENLLVEGITLELAKYRKQQVSDVLYHLDFKVPKEKNQPIPANLKLELTINDLENDLLLDFNEESSKLKLLKVNGKVSEIHHKKEHLIIDVSDLKMGKNNIKISFEAGESSLNRNEEFLYTLLVPDRASTLFPCFDQPDIKAKYKLSITAPKDWEVMCGGFEESFELKKDFVEHIYEETDKMSTYLFSFVAGKFVEKHKNPGSFLMSFLYRETDEEKITESLDTIFDIHQKSIDFLEEYTAKKFPFKKMDFVTIPPFQYGGMEHVGAIQYRESSLFLDKNATENRKLSRAKLIAHETSHMWFGDLVTMRWFNDVWMKEVFANFMADKIMNPVFPTINHELNFMMSHYPSAYSEDRTQGTNAIRQDLANLKNAGSLYGRIIYNKAPIMMRQLENVLGKKAFKKGIQEYISTYANDNADWNELVEILDKNSDKDIKKWSEIWVNSAGRPIFSDSIIYENNIIKSFEIYQKAEDNSPKIWAQSFKVGLVYDSEVKVIDAEITNKKLILDNAIGLPKPNSIIYNYNGFGYGVFPVNSDEIELLKNIEDEVARGYAFINLYENMLNGKLVTLKTYNVMLDAILVEKNELISNYLSGRIRNIYWTFLNEKEKEQIQQKTESNIFKLLNKNIPKNIKKTLFNLYESIIISENGVENLYQIWKKEKSFENLFLNENDFINLAEKLAILQHLESVEILDIQKKEIENKDRLARFIWLLPTLSQDDKVRDDFMKSLLNKENREKESWVLSALNNLHHPLRQKEGIKHLEACLNTLEEVQLTGDIFFPKGWLASSIGNYSSKEAYDILQDFLDKNPNYNPILKKKLLQTTDDLIRAQEIKTKEWIYQK